MIYNLRIFSLDRCLTSRHNRFMEDTNRYMSELFRIINGALRLDIERVRNYTAFLAEKLEKDGDLATAQRIRKLLQETDHQLRPASVNTARALPVDSESRFPLIEKVNLQALEEPPVVLDDAQWASVREFVSVAKSRGQMESQGVNTALSMLMYGAPGTGKSRLARFIATELDLDMFVARLDGLISSFLGSTAKNIRALFDFAASTPCILFLDEFDAIAKLRGDAQELGELKRVVNSFIQNLDSVGQHTIILAATNHEELLDNAVWRRFSYRLKLSYPNATMRHKLWEQFLPTLPTRKKDLLALVDLTDGFSGADIQEVCLRLHRKQVTDKIEPTLAETFTAIRNLAVGEGEDRRVLLSRIKNSSSAEIARILRDRDKRLYSAELLGRLLGVSKATAHRWATLRSENNG